MDVTCLGPPSTHEVLAAVNVSSEDVDVEVRIMSRNAYERDETVPRPDTSVEVIMLPSLTVTRQCLNKLLERASKGSKDLLLR